MQILLQFYLHISKISSTFAAEEYLFSCFYHSECFRSDTRALFICSRFERAKKLQAIIYIAHNRKCLKSKKNTLISKLEL